MVGDGGIIQKIRKPSGSKRYENLLDPKDTKTFWIQDQDQRSVGVGLATELARPILREMRGTRVSVS